MVLSAEADESTATTVRASAHEAVNDLRIIEKEVQAAISYLAEGERRAMDSDALIAARYKDLLAPPHREMEVRP